MDPELVESEKLQIKEKKRLFLIISHRVRVLHPVNAVPVSQIRVSGLVIVTGVGRLLRVRRRGGIY